jgi:membrane-associated phospholipid phosphatase
MPLGSRPQSAARTRSRRSFAFLAAAAVLGMSRGAFAQEPKKNSDADDPDLVAPTRTLPVAARPIPLSIVPRTGGGRPLAWNPQWRRAGAADVVVIASAGAVLLGSQIVKPLPPIIHGPLLFDETVRNTFRLQSVDTRGWAGDVSDVLLSLSMTGPFLVDSMTTAWWYRGSKDVAQQMAVIDMETLAITGAVQGLSSDIIGRARPYTRICGTSELPADSQECQTFSENRSFFSGHTSLSFASASLVCQHHLQMHLFENGAADVMSCIGSMLTAGTTGAFRILSDNHYATDVLTGAVIGTTLGFALPWVLHYKPANTSSFTRQTGMTLQFVPTGFGAAAVGVF